MQASDCAICGNEPIFYRAPKDICILVCCENADCKSRKMPPAAGADIFEAANAWMRCYGVKR